MSNDSTPTTSSNERDWFRLSYPQELMPTIVIGSEEFVVPEISERGFRVRGSHFSEFRSGEKVHGTFYFTDGTSLQVFAEVFRQDRREFVLRPEDNIPLGRIVAEQRRLIQRFQEEQ